MNHEEIFKLAETLGWKKWGGFTKKKGNSYQCFRNKNRYIWIGYRFIENPLFGHSLPYQDKLTSQTEIIEFLQ
jgi:hypothetical protein